MSCPEAVAEPGSGRGSETLSILVIYEDLESGLRAGQVLNRTVQRLQAPLEVRVDFWRSDLFREPAFLQQVAREEADIVFLSTNGRAQLPPTLHSWVRQWFGPQGSHPRALVVLLGDNANHTPGTTRMLEELSAAAQLAGVDVFRHAAAPETEWESAIEEIHRRSDTKTLLLDEVLHRAEQAAHRG